MCFWISDWWDFQAPMCPNEAHLWWQACKQSGKLYFEHLPWTSLPLEPIQVQKVTSEHQSMGASLHFHSCTHSHKYGAKKSMCVGGWGGSLCSASTNLFSLVTSLMPDGLHKSTCSIPGELLWFPPHQPLLTSPAFHAFGGPFPWLPLPQLPPDPRAAAPFTPLIPQ